MFYANVPGAKEQTALLGQGYYTVPCNEIPNVSLTFGGKSFATAPDTFNLGQASKGSSDCVGGIVADPQLTGNFWVIGGMCFPILRIAFYRYLTFIFLVDVFLQNVYTVFDFGNTQVGFADLA